MNTNPFDTIQSEIQELKGMVQQILSAPKEDYSLKVYSVQDAAKIMSVDPQTIKNHIDNGLIKAFRFGGRIRIKHDQIFDSKNEVKSLKYKRKRQA